MATSRGFQGLEALSGRPLDQFGFAEMARDVAIELLLGEETGPVSRPPDEWDSG
ncbi:MAG TPA: hypothetical protein VIX59_18295 [Candidatus Binataceae bacterium]